MHAYYRTPPGFDNTWENKIISDGSSPRPHPDIERAQLYNPGGAVNRLIMRRKEANSLASKPKLVVDTDWEENLEFGGI